jgi:uncharacterized protein
MTDNALIIFIKNPIKGQVKTRIARTVGDEQALAIYLELSKITRDNAVTLRGQKDISDAFKVSDMSAILRGITLHLFYSDFIDINDEWSNSHFNKHVQVGKDLGERMFNAFDFVLKTHNHACIIGSDCPTLSVEILNQSFEKLWVNDCVVGPSTDGGYYLLGIKNKTNGTKNDIFSISQLFQDMAWSTDQVLPTTIERIMKNHLTYSLLPELTDIDEEIDWLHFQKNRPPN